MSSPEIRPLPSADIERAGLVLGRAFTDNPGYVAVFQHLDAAARGRAVTALKTGFTRAAVGHWTAEGLYDGDRLLGAQLVLDPGVYPPSLRSKLVALGGALGAGPRAWLGLLRMDAVMQSLHLQEPHFYLFVIGIDVPEQGKGHGKRLLHALNARADAARLPCYLETDRETSVRLYQSVGYRVLTEQRIASVNDLPMWTMRRDPA